ncbi:uncharacterized protein FIBRA_06082 [Fibroporia radiculosa]|uniref:Pentacotripeptide-repeat region of PRORP domain-containing protein n=1 Tax=Fibroporia radiculosa TaxID=599839 RepID=J4GS59_9APHY|nr:uncharacterized protein FIBRA_06082 [Fibroporia radiculosa]CCM03930.1 predicted protein [Fibroporia radiculosa]
MSAFRLPASLLDLTLVQASLRSHARVPRTTRLCAVYASRRHGHGVSAALAQVPYPDGLDLHSDQFLYGEQPGKDREITSTDVGGRPRSGLLSELEERVLSLQEAEPLVDTLTYSEEDLLEIYEDLLKQSTTVALQESSTVDPAVQEEHDRNAVLDVYGRLFESDIETLVPGAKYPYLGVVERLQEICLSLDAFRISTPSLSADAALSNIPTGILTNDEWLSLIRTCITAQDSAAAETVLSLMKQSGVTSLEDAINSVLSMYALNGNIAATERVLFSYATSPSERQRDLHVKAYIKALPFRAFPTDALDVLHSYETKGIPPPQKSYTRVMYALLNVRDRAAEARARVFDLFAHMRYAAHPDPDAVLYCTMIRACSSVGMPAEPERAMDLFTEMTTDRGQAPTQQAYLALARVFVCSGEERYIHSAFRLAKEMLDAHRDARGLNAFRPDNRLFETLLDGAKRIRDLGRTRWILAEMVRENMEDTKAGLRTRSAGLDEPAMRHVFHSYATYKPPFRRSSTVLVDSEATSTSNTTERNVVQSTDDVHVESSTATEPADAADAELEEDFSSAQLPSPRSSTQFSYMPPQTRNELLAEVGALFARVIEERQAVQTGTTGNDADAVPRPFGNVVITPRLINSYLSVHYAHSPLEVWGHLYRTLHNSLGVPRDALTYIDALERCTTCSPGERSRAFKIAEEVWGSWQNVEEAWRTRGERTQDDPTVVGVDARLVERANAAMIRMLTLTGRLQRALNHVRTFAEHYPPLRVLSTQAKPVLYSSRPILSIHRPLVRLTSATDIPDDHVPPMLTFSELEILHHRLLAAGDRTGLGFVKWVCKAYEGALWRRRAAALRDAPS